MNSGFSFLKICNMSKIISIPTLTIQYKKYIILIVIIIKRILVMPDK